MNTPQTLIDPCLDGIRPHACIKHIPQWPDNSPRMLALRQEYQLNGCKAAIHMTSKHEIIDPDSLDRWRAAKALQLDCIPAIIEPDASVWLACLQIICQRRHYTKSAIAFLIYPGLKPALEEARAIRYTYLQNAGKSVSELNSLTGIPKNIEDLAEMYGVNRHYVFDSKRVHDLFAKDANYKAQMLPRLLAEPIGGEHESNRPVGLGAIIAGYAGKANEDKARSDRSQLELFTDAMKRFCIRAPQVDEAAARKIVRHQFASMSPEEIDAAIATAAIVVSEGRALNKATK